MIVLHGKGLVYTCLLVLCMLSCQALASADYVREKRWADEITPGLIVGEPIYISQSNAHEFLGLYAEADGAKTAVIVVHGMSLHPDWGIISTLRQQLFDGGYATLAIQMPVLAADAEANDYPAVFPEAVERLSLAAAFLKQKDYERIVIVSHSNGSLMSRLYMINNPVEIDSWVALSLTREKTFEGVKVPVLDLYAENDLPHVLSATAQRKASLRYNMSSKQIMIANTDHFYNGHENEMVKVVKKFLDDLEAACGV